MLRLRQTIFWAVGFLLLILLPACATQTNGSATAPFTDEKAVDLLWNYEQALTNRLSDPSAYVTSTEKEWLAQFLADRQAGKRPKLTWKANGSVVKVEKANDKEALVTLQADVDGTVYTLQFTFRPVGGEWKIANHQTPDGKWWRPGSTSY